MTLPFEQRDADFSTAVRAETHAAQNSTNPTRPTPLPVRLENIPESLTALNQWVLWRYVLKSGKWTKVPFQTTGRPASTANSQTWNCFDVIAKTYATGDYDGIGIALDGVAAEDGLTLAAVDIDKAVGNPERERLAKTIIQNINSYAELSPSGIGYRIFLRASPLRSGINRNGVELYTSGRYLTVTGHTLDGDHA